MLETLVPNKSFFPSPCYLIKYHKFDFKKIHISVIFFLGTLFSANTYVRFFRLRSEIKIYDASIYSSEQKKSEKVNG